MTFLRSPGARLALAACVLLLAVPLLSELPTTARAAGQAMPGALGINVATPTYWGGERSFMNLAVGGDWMASRQNQGGWAPFDPARLDALGNVKSLQPGENANYNLVPPETAYTPAPVRIRCKWQGTGTVQPGGVIRNVAMGQNNSFEFDWTGTKEASKPNAAWITVTATTPGDPVRQIDCREAKADEGALFSADFVKLISDYKVVRFLDWQGTNKNPLAVTWANRTRPESQSQATELGVAVEHMVALANQTGADPWFTMLWNGDEDYVRRFAEYVRDHLSPDRRVYVELSNEVWNYVFPQTQQAEREGVEADLSPHRFQAMIWRYADKTVWMMKIWSEVFAAKPDRLVRVLAAQHDGAWAIGEILKRQDTAKNIDALATAPYFGYATLEEPRTKVKDPAVLFDFLAKDLEASMAKAVDNKKLADQYGLRYIAYEAGQHIVSHTEVDTIALLNRDPRMYDLYKKYLAAWRDKVGDLMTIFQTTGGISQYGAWGIQEYPGQPLDQTPKRRAILEFMGR